MPPSVDKVTPTLVVGDGTCLVVQSSGERGQVTVAAPSEQQHRTPEYRLVSQLASGSVAVGVGLRGRMLRLLMC